MNRRGYVRQCLGAVFLAELEASEKNADNPAWNPRICTNMSGERSRSQCLNNNNLDVPNARHYSIHRHVIGRDLEVGSSRLSQLGERAREHCDPGFWSYFLLAGLGRYAARFIIVADVANERNKALWAVRK